MGGTFGDRWDIPMCIQRYLANEMTVCMNVRQLAVTGGLDERAASITVWQPKARQNSTAEGFSLVCLLSISHPHLPPQAPSWRLRAP